MIVVFQLCLKVMSGKMRQLKLLAIRTQEKQTQIKLAKQGIQVLKSKIDALALKSHVPSSNNRRLKLGGKWGE
jgi:hypothetical protein